MKKHLVLILIISLFVSLFSLPAYSAQPVYQLYKNSPLTHLRTITADDTAIDLTASKGDFANKPAAAVGLGTTDDGLGSTTGAEFAINTTGSGSCTITFWGWRVGTNPTNGGPAIKLFSIIGATSGTMDVVAYPDGSDASGAFWVHQGTVTSYGVTATAFNSGNNNVLLVRTDLMGYAWIYPEVSALATATAVKVYIAGL